MVGKWKRGRKFAVIRSVGLGCWTWDVYQFVDIEGGQPKVDDPSLFGNSFITTQDHFGIIYVSGNNEGQLSSVAEAIMKVKMSNPDVPVFKKIDSMEGVDDSMIDIDLSRSLRSESFFLKIDGMEGVNIDLSCYHPSESFYLKMD